MLIGQVALIQEGLLVVMLFILEGTLFLGLLRSNMQFPSLVQRVRYAFLPLPLLSLSGLGLYSVNFRFPHLTVLFFGLITRVLLLWLVIL